MEERGRRVVVHGGGWGLGTYRRVVPELSATSSYALDVITSHATDQVPLGATDRQFVPAPDWQPWQRDRGGELTFPPLCEVSHDITVRHLRDDLLPPAHRLVRGAAAIVSKPGGGTMIDSLAAATPVVLLEPCGAAEARNGELWEHLGFGISFDRWRSTGFPISTLAELHRNLLAARTDGRTYPPALRGHRRPRPTEAITDV
jgi:UDP-N-acetylglucosamine:LPS N-acetylglucosamine transferase